MFNERFARMMLWALAVIVPGGLVLLALWAAARAVKERYFVRDALHDVPTPVPNLLPKALPAPAPVANERVAA